MGKNLTLFIQIIIILLFSGCQEEINSPVEKNKLEGTWICEFSYTSITQIGGDIPDTLQSILELKQDSFVVNIVKSQLNPDGTTNNINKRHYHGSYSVNSDTIKFNISGDIVYTDRFSFEFYDDSLTIDGTTKSSSDGPIFVRVRAFLWNNSDNLVKGTFYKAKNQEL